MATNPAETGSASLQWSDTGPRLAPVVRSMWSLAGPPEQAALPGIIAPDAHVEFVFHLGEPWWSQALGKTDWVLQPAAFVHATSHGAVQFRPTGPVSALAFRVTPVVATRILGRYLADLWDTPVALDTLIGGEATTLLESLRGVPAEERFALLRQWIVGRLADWTSEDWSTERLFRTILWRSRDGSVARMCRFLGPSERSLRRRFAAHTGLSPKSVQLSGRLLAACALLREAPTLEITEIASRVGFYDHAAFTHAFTRRIGLTPRCFRAEPVVFYEREQASP
jgi:AraC-like DNA-binding protein